ncbi:eL24 family ribosomal protein [Methylobacter luteus]|uniref:hypothetical protein n=1 Tax=Methylobacter luteus TaxID=415 RepID=UPI0012DCCA9D|nr:hypothetical protein [Methylobacter luteus]
MALATEVNTDATGLVIRGYDPVAYFTEGRPVPGRSDLYIEYGGGKYLFSTPENREMRSKQIPRPTCLNTVVIVHSVSPWQRSSMSIQLLSALWTRSFI